MEGSGQNFLQELVGFLAFSMDVVRIGQTFWESCQDWSNCGCTKQVKTAPAVLYIKRNTVQYSMQSNARVPILCLMFHNGSRMRVVKLVCAGSLHVYVRYLM